MLFNGLLHWLCSRSEQAFNLIHHLVPPDLGELNAKVCCSGFRFLRVCPRVSNIDRSAALKHTKQAASPALSVDVSSVYQTREHVAAGLVSFFVASELASIDGLRQQDRHYILPPCVTIVSGFLVRVQICIGTFLTSMSAGGLEQR